MKSKDSIARNILVLSGILFAQNNWTYKSLGDMLSLSASRVHDAVKELVKSNLIVKTQDNIFKPIKKNCFEFFVYGIPYIFPLKIGGEVRGIPAFISAKPVSDKIVGNRIYVWPYSEGNTFGLSIEPIHKNVPKVAMVSDNLYMFFVILDCLRSNKRREKDIAKKELQKILNLQIIDENKHNNP
ncbi:hypothetical protein [Deferribacter abyssi]|uniref:hypothetical protein n=1 Tax=Deferribacter abyssi TaxID=213806 RepID=UPI003C1D3C38